jgi:hypothetical protein
MAMSGTRKALLIIGGILAVPFLSQSRRCRGGFNVSQRRADYP